MNMSDNGKNKEGNPIINDDDAIEISDDEAPDIEAAKQKLRDQNEKKRDKMRATNVMAVQGQMQVQVPEGASPKASGRAVKIDSDRAPEKTVESFTTG